MTPMTPARRKTMVGWALAGGIALAAMAIGYGLGKADEDTADRLAWEMGEGADVDVGPLGGDEAAPPELRESDRADRPELDRAAPAGATASRRTAAAPAGGGGLLPGERVRVDVPDEVEPAAPLEPELVREESDSGFLGFGRSEVVTIPAGTPLRLRLLEGVSSQTAQVGDEVRGELTAPVVVDGETVFPAGTDVRGEVVLAQALKRIGGRAQLGIAFTRLADGGDGVPIEAAWSRVGRSETRKDAATIAGGAVAGAVLGNQAKKNDRGKVLGGLLGAGVGAAVASKTQGERIELPEGTELEVTLGDAVVASIDR